MVVPILKKVVMFFPNKLVQVNDTINKIINLPDKASKTFTYVTKVTGATTGAAGAANDLAEAIA